MEKGKKFHQALINLSKNGIEAIKDGGTLTLRLNETDENAVIRIIDNGIEVWMLSKLKIGITVLFNKR
ncbi:ATP-binding protein [Anaerobacillus sp. HL2]|nr:ATP-binding protein [Anaerobacillus sp. HL2]